MAISLIHQILYGVSLIDKSWFRLTKGKSLKLLLLDLSAAQLKEMEKRGFLPKWKG
jgi:hypothetical protein